MRQCAARTCSLESLFRRFELFYLLEEIYRNADEITVGDNPDQFAVLDDGAFKLKFKFLVKYNDKKGITIVPALLIKVINASHQTSFESPLKVFK